VKTGKVEAKPSLQRRFRGKYTEQDVALLAEVDRAHRRLSGPATRHILERDYSEFGKPEFARLAGIQDNALVEGKNGAIIRSTSAKVIFRPHMPKPCRNSTPRS
jgi:hypothetical protein